MARLVVGFDNTLSLLFHSFFLDFFSKYAPLFPLGAFLFLGYSPILFCQVNPNNISLLPTKK